jgi:hypothetical protein
MFSIYKINKKLEKKFSIFGIQYSHYEGVFHITCVDSKCLDVINSLKNNMFNAFLVNSNNYSEISKTYSLYFYGLFDAIIYGWRDWSPEHRKTLYCAPYDRRFTLTIRDIQPCSEDFKKYLNASPVMRFGDKVIFEYEPGIQDGICDSRTGICSKWIGNGLSAIFNYRVIDRDYYMFLDLSTSDAIRQYFFCRTFEGRGCLQFQSKEIIHKYFVVGKRRYTLSSRPSDDDDGTDQYSDLYLNYSDIK